jgi:hypothetical protein
MQMHVIAGDSLTPVWLGTLSGCRHASVLCYKLKLEGIRGGYGSTKQMFYPINQELLLL